MDKIIKYKVKRIRVEDIKSMPVKWVKELKAGWG